MSTANDTYYPLIADFIDGELGEDLSRDVERHLRECAECTSLAEDLRRLDARAASLPAVHPSPELWSRIKDRVEAPRNRFRELPWLASAAALAVLTLSGGIIYMLSGPGSSPDDEALVLMSQIAEDLQQAERHYQQAITGLEAIFQENRASLDPELSAMLQQNLEVIEAAVVESRQALATEPESQIARESLLEGLRLKVNLLQNAILMMNEVRKGDGEGALDLIEKMQAPKPPNSI